MNNIKSKWLLGLAFLAVMASCTDDTDDGPTVTEGILEIEASNLPDNGDDFLYTMWMISNGVNFNLGTFGVENGLADRTSWTIGDLTTLENADRVLVSIHPAAVTPTSPDEGVMLEGVFGDISANMGSLTTSPMTTGVDDFSNALGTYLLSTPTTSTMSEEFSGIWFGNNTTGTVVPGLVLPTLTPGWTYQGFVNLGGGLILPTGKFYNPNEGDLESIYNGPGSPYDVPGEDFNQNLPMMGTPPDLRGKEVWLTVQPDTFSSTLFPLPIFRDTITMTVGETFTLSNVFPDFAGTVSRR